MVRLGRRTEMYLYFGESVFYMHFPMLSVAHLSVWKCLFTQNVVLASYLRLEASHQIFDLSLLALRVGS